MKIYKKYLLILMSGTLISLQGCSSKESTSVVQETKEEISQEENNIKEENIKEVEQPFEVNEEVAQELEQGNLAIIPCEEEISTEEDIVNYFENASNKIEVTSEQDYQENETTIQSMLATFILFLNDEMTIKDYTYSSLKEETKEKLLDTFTRFDEKINEAYPEYSISIIGTFDFIKEKAKEGKVILNNSLVEALGEEYVNETKNNFQDGYDEMLEVFGYWGDKVLEKAREEKSK